MSEPGTNDDQNRGTQMTDTESKDDPNTHEAPPTAPKDAFWGSQEMEALIWDQMEAAVRASFKAQRKPEGDTNQKNEG